MTTIKARARITDISQHGPNIQAFGDPDAVYGEARITYVWGREDSGSIIVPIATARRLTIGSIIHIDIDLHPENAA
jgi:hypothetical protein